MIVRMGLLNKKPDWSLEDFRRYWTETHGPIAARLPGLRGYLQHHIVETAQRGITYKRGPEHVDGLSELVFDDDAAMRAALASEVAPSLAEDEARFLGRLRVIAVDRREMIAPDPGRKLLKRMSFLRRRADVDAATFEREWRVEHARLVKLMPGVSGYRQNLVIERQAVKGTPCSYGELPIDGVVELWFTDTDSLNAAFASPEGVRTMAHAETFIDEITPFLVETRAIVQ
ncbi:MAG: EthD family reductase [Ideonella sp.]|nr:EthD family reductase [Ideonella sp.]